MNTLCALMFTFTVATTALAQDPTAPDRRRQGAPPPTDTATQSDPRANPRAAPATDPRFNPRRGMAIDPRTGRPIDPRAAATPVVATREDPTLTSQLAGVWKGVYCTGVAVNLADLELRVGDGGHGLSGEVRFASLPDPRMRMVKPTEGSWRVEGSIDAGSRALTLTPKGWIKPPAGLL